MILILLYEGADGELQHWDWWWKCDPSVGITLEEYDG